MFGHAYHMHKFMFEYDCVCTFPCLETNIQRKESGFLKKDLKFEEMCNIHNSFPGICNKSLLGNKNVSIVAKGAYEAVLENE